MNKNIILAGVGGQGILSIAFVIDHAAMDAGFEFKQAEVHGMAQRGGAVQSNLRYADGPIHSDIIPVGKVDLVLSVEPLEALRYLHYLKPGGWVVTSTTPFVNIPDYPDSEVLLERLAALDHAVLVDTAHFARAAGNRRAQNMVMVGAAAPLLDFDSERLQVFVAKLFERKGEKLVRVNQRAFALGEAAGRFFRALADGGVARHDALRLVGKLAPDGLDAATADALAADWAMALADDDSLLESVLAQSGPVAADRLPAGA